jgi:hypothetical protein
MVGRRHDRRGLCYGCAWGRGIDGTSLRPPKENILVAWREAFLAAEADAAGGQLSSAIRRLEEILVKAAGLTGTAVDHLLPRTYGLLGTLNYRAGNQKQAREFTLKAKAQCERTGDHEGAEIYRKNLDIIDAGRPILG